MKLKIPALLLSAILSLSALVSVPAQAATGDCTITGTYATCNGSDLTALRDNSTVTTLTLDHAPLDGEVFKGMKALTQLDYSGAIEVDLREVLKAPALTSFHVYFDTKQPRIKTGQTFTIPTFTNFDGKPYSFEVGDLFDQGGWDAPPVKQVGFNAFVALSQGYIQFLDGYYEGIHDAGSAPLQWSMEIGNQMIVSAYEELSWLGTGALKAYYYPDGGASFIDPSATTLPTGATLRVSGTETSTGYAMRTKCVWLRGSTVVKAVDTSEDYGCEYQVTKADSGKKITVKATHNEYWGPTESWESTTETFAKNYTVQDPILLKLGTIGKVAVGQKITPKVTGAPAGAKLKFQWRRDSTPIKGATASSYTPVAADKGKRISYTVSGIKPGMYSLDYYQEASEKAAQGKFAVTKAPSISGKAVFGQTLKVNAGSRSSKPAKITYQWLRDGKAIKSATKTSYKLGRSDIGKKISVKVTSSGQGFATQTSTTAKTKTVAKATFKLKKSPTVTGKVKVGKKLTAKPGSWSPKPDKYSYQWYRSGAAIKKATKSTYKVTKRDRGAVIYVKVTAKKRGYKDKSAQSKVK